MAVAGAPVYAEDQQDGTLLALGDVAFRRKAAPQSVTSNVTPQNDNDLSIELPIGTFRVEALLHVTGASGGDVRVDWTFSGAESSARSCLGPAEGTTDVGSGNSRSNGYALATDALYGTDGSAVATSIREDILIVVTTAGTLQLRWAQGTSSGTSTTLSTASRMYVTRLE